MIGTGGRLKRVHLRGIGEHREIRGPRDRCSFSDFGLFGVLAKGADCSRNHKPRRVAFNLNSAIA
jgi:hypothetical protein